jgi:hypothetical protein
MDRKMDVVDAEILVASLSWMGTLIGKLFTPVKQTDIKNRE